MRLVYAIVAIVIATVAVGIAWCSLRENPTDGVFGSRANAAIVAQPSRVEAYRLGSLPAHIYSQGAVPSDYPVIAGPTALPTEISAEVSNALLSPNTYVLDSAKACVPSYGVKFSFFRNADRVDVLLCFECDTFWVSRDDRGVGGEGFENSRAVFVRAAKVAFPSDAVVQQLH